ncbi:MAG: hypothetical protein OER86_13270 [Phycisphaerae bacterium]|nr:hypothetical protein [Phycisphaerae bacterium]
MRRLLAAAPPAALLCLFLLPTPALAAKPASVAAPDATAHLVQQIDRAIAKVRSRSLRSDQHTPWVIMHAVIAFEKNLDVLDTAAGKKANAVDYLLRQARHDGKLIFQEIGGVPRLATVKRGAPRSAYFKVQDHVDQYLMALADAGVTVEAKIRADTGRIFTIEQKLDAARREFQPTQELGWTLVALSTWMPFEQTWKTTDGRSYRIEDVLALAIERDPRRETEGGPHHLYGVAYALERYQATRPRAWAHPPLTGTWAKARAYLDKYIALARQWQQEDGAFSGDVFRRNAAPRSSRHLVSTTGHFLEWMNRAQTPKQLRQTWVQRAVARLCATLLAEPLENFSDGGIYHAAHALRMYRQVLKPASD